MSESQSKVSEPCAAFRKNAEHWRHLDALLGGTLAMREAGTAWLPQEEKETHRSYMNRLERSILFGGYEEALSGLVSKPFSRQVTISGTLPEQLSGIEFDIDNEGRGLTEFARDVFRDQIHRGLTFILVDFPDPKRAITATEQRRLGIRPYFCHVMGSDLIGWASRRNIAGRLELSQIRIRESVIRHGDDFGEQEVRRIRVWNAPPVDEDGAMIEGALGYWELWEEQTGESRQAADWVRVDSGEHTFPGIPIIPIYAGRTGFLQARPPLEDLGWLNIRHWQSTSDQNNILRYSRIYTPWVVGMAETEYKNMPPVGVNAMLRAENPNAKFGILEHSGASIQAGERDIKALEERMEVLGLQPMLRRSGDATATAKAIDESRGDTDMQSWVRNLEAALVRAFEFACIWAGERAKPIPLGDDFAVDVFNEFGLTTQADSKVKALIESRKNGDISRETYLNELVRIKYLNPNLDVDEESRRIESEAASFMIAPENHSADDPTQDQPVDPATE